MVDQSITSKATSTFTARSISCIASFISCGCIWPEPEALIVTLQLQGLRGP